MSESAGDSHMPDGGSSQGPRTARTRGRLGPFWALVGQCRGRLRAAVPESTKRAPRGLQEGPRTPPGAGPPFCHERPF
eukprot:1326515-Pyramimonas_sp.AAC.1